MPSAPMAPNVPSGGELPPGEAPAGDTPAVDVPADAPPADAPPADAPPADAPPPAANAPLQASPMTRLTQREYRRTVQAAYGANNLPAVSLPADGSDHVFVTNATSKVGDFEEFVNAAFEYGAALAPGLVTACDWAMNAESCASTHFAAPLTTLFRGEQTEADLTELARLIAAELAAEKAVETALTTAIARTLLDDRFLFRVEHRQAVAADETSLLTPNALAQRLSYFLLDAPPDADLLAAVQSGQLANPDALRLHTERLLADERTKDMLWEFVSGWLSLREVKAENTLGQAMIDETRRFTEYVMFTEGVPLTDLFTASYSFINAELAAHYGVPAPAVDFARYEFPAESKRQGILTHASFLMSNARADDRGVSTIFRGLIVFERLFCRHLPGPPEDIVNAINSGEELPADRTADEKCSGCHNNIDPIGRLFDGYNATGASWPAEFTDSATVTAGSDIDGAYQDVAELSGALSESSTFVDCFLGMWFRYALGRELNANDSASLTPVLEKLKTGGSMRAALLELPATEAFRMVNVLPPSLMCE